MFIKQRVFIAVLAMMVTLLSAATNASPAKPFELDSYAQIIAASERQPMLLVLWSLDCPPCREEMPDMAEFAASHPGLKLVLVSVDGMAAETEVTSILASNKLDSLESWIFANPYIEKLRFKIDPGWRGELPRSYLYIPGEQRQRIRGRIDFSLLDEYLAGLDK